MVWVLVSTLTGSTIATSEDHSALVALKRKYDQASGFTVCTIKRNS